MRTGLFSAANLAITAGYIFLAAVVVPRMTINLRRTRIGGIGFFLLCGLHHLEGVAHVLFEPNETVAHTMLSLHMLLIDVPQAICVWMFVTGLYIEIVKWGPWRDETEVLRALVAARIEEEASRTDAAIAEAEAARRS